MSRPALPAGFHVIPASKRRHRGGRVPGSEVDVLLDSETPTTSLLAGINHLVPGARIPLHHHDYEELQFILSGSGLALDSTGGEHPIGPGATVYCAAGPGAAHGFVSTGDAPLAILFVYPTPGGGAPALNWVEQPTGVSR